MVPAKYTRSQIFSAIELPKEKHAEMRHEMDYLTDEEFEDQSFVDFFGEFLPLSMFMRLDNSKVWHGVYGTSYFSGYFIRFNRSNDEALVAERFS